MNVKWSKLDSSLSGIYHSYLDFQINPTEKRLHLDPVFIQHKEKLFITVIYEGAIARIMDTGFELGSSEGGNILHGFVHYKDIAQLSNLAEVKLLKYGNAASPVLLRSVAAIKARGTSTVPGVWQLTGISSDILTPSNPAVTGDGGANVLIGIIDTGIDWTHDNFKELTGGNSRIERIWDQGLVPQSGESSPDVSLMQSGQRYGVEYQNALINTELAKNPVRFNVIRHRDRDGHGTHVAGIASGNGRAGDGLLIEGFKYMGVAPLARIVIVKYLDLQRYPSNANHDTRFRDAIAYINNVGDSLNLPVVINCSFGYQLCPHDGYSESVAGQPEYLYAAYTGQAGKACVFAIGNEAGKRFYTEITMPAAGSIELELNLEDSRTRRPKTDDLSVDVWYSSAVATVQPSIKVPNASAYSAVATLNGPEISRRYNVNKQYRINHRTVTTTDKNGVALARNNIRFSLIPFNKRHKTGRYWVKFDAPTGTVLHLWTLQTGEGYGLMPQTPAVGVTGIVFSEASTFRGPSDAENVITVASYEPDSGMMSDFSSQGQLISHGAAPASYTKPDISAPGTDIKSSRSSHRTAATTLSDNPDSNEMRRFIDEMLSLGYTTMQGTSMAAPHITGVVALMLSKNRNLNMEQIKTLLKAHAVTNTLDAVHVTTSRKANQIEAGAGKIDALTTFNNVPTP